MEKRKRTFSYDEMSEYSKTFTANADDMKVEVFFYKKENRTKRVKLRILKMDFKKKMLFLILNLKMKKQKNQ